MEDEVNRDAHELELDGPIELNDWDPHDEEEEVEGDEPSDAAFVAEVGAKIAALRGLYVETQRDAVLAAQFERLLTEKDSGVEVRRWAGIVVKAASGAGKTTMVGRFLKNHPRVHGFGSDESDFVHIDVPSPVTNKSLGLAVLRTMYPQWRDVAPSGSNASQKADLRLSDIWEEVRSMASGYGIWGLWIDEAHDLGNGGPHMLDVVQASFKRWMAHGHRPILILSGTPDVERLFRTREFRRRFLTVESPTLSATSDTPQLRQVMAKYLRAAGLGIDESLREFMPRLVHAGTYQIGWTLNVVIEAIRVALLERADRLALEHFAQSYAEIVQCADRDNPFIADDWSGIDTVMQRGRHEEPPQNKSRRKRREDTPW